MQGADTTAGSQAVLDRDVRARRADATGIVINIIFHAWAPQLSSPM